MTDYVVFYWKWGLFNPTVCTLLSTLENPSFLDIYRVPLGPQGGRRARESSGRGRVRLLLEFSCPGNVLLSCSIELLHKWQFWWCSKSSIPALSLGHSPYKAGPQERNRIENTVRSLLFTRKSQPDFLTLHSCHSVRLVGFRMICREFSCFVVSVSGLTLVGCGFK